MKHLSILYSLLLDVNILYRFKVRPFDRGEETATSSELNWTTALSGCHIF